MDTDEQRKRMGLLEYLKKVKEQVAQKNWLDLWEGVRIVVGSESCDLDSAVSTLVYAFHVHKTSDAKCLVLPVLNTPEQDYILKTEVVFALQEQGIDSSQLIFLDQITISKSKHWTKVQLILVDHSTPVGKLADSRATVAEIVDHRALVPGQDYPEDALLTVEPVGSCATLVAERLLNHPDSCALTATTAYLLYETILLDTINFSPEARKATAKDRRVADELVKMIPVTAVKPPQQILSRLLDAKADIAKLSISQLLQKDMKIITTETQEEMKLAICSLPALIKERCISEAAQTEIEQFCDQRELVGAVILGTSILCDEQLQRDILLYVPDHLLLNRIVNALHERRRNSTLHLQAIDDNFRPKNLSFRYFNQTNVTASRKQILPVLQSVLDTASVMLPPFHGEQDDDDENESNLDSYPTSVPPNSYVGEGFVHDTQSVIGHVTQRVQRMQTGGNPLYFPTSGEKRYRSDSPLGERLFDYDNIKGRSEPFTPSNTFVDESVLMQEGAHLDTQHVGILQNKMTYLKRRQESDYAREPNEPKDSEIGVFEMEDDESLSRVPKQYGKAQFPK
ncbi:exopolyphosphatase PRUNE1-like [Paramacrobiotus metropolitanus]|uniref:exopolyphosphatase PRUNE1-like n=1 Tax=Paramacrobiotus metropolitanus TaxID=2943436 RepID=UPI002445B220|nr:exopolyphosphatase PRUNE1-like [Paramacrobiotus metropolitanus]